MVKVILNYITRLTFRRFLLIWLTILSSIILILLYVAHLLPYFWYQVDHELFDLIKDRTNTN